MNQPIHLRHQMTEADYLEVCELANARLFNRPNRRASCVLAALLIICGISNFIVCWLSGPMIIGVILIVSALWLLYWQLGKKHRDRRRFRSSRDRDTYIEWTFSTDDVVVVTNKVTSRMKWSCFVHCLWAPHGFLLYFGADRPEVAFLPYRGFSDPADILQLPALLKLKGIPVGEQAHPTCPRCGYDLRGSLAGGSTTCPECGELAWAPPAPDQLINRSTD